MGLIDKIRQKGRDIALAGIAGLSCLASGCFQVQSYQGRANLMINTEPQGARVYEMPGRYLGTTPQEGGYEVNDENLASGLLQTCELVFVKDGYLPAKRQFQLQIRKEPFIVRDILPGTKYYHSFSYHELIILERDPNAPNVQYNHTTIRQEESALDESLKLGELMLIIKALSPVR